MDNKEMERKFIKRGALSSTAPSENLKAAIYCCSQAVEWQETVLQTRSAKFNDNILAAEKIRKDCFSKRFELPRSYEDYAVRQRDVYLKKSARFIRRLNGECECLLFIKQPCEPDRATTLALCREFMAECITRLGNIPENEPSEIFEPECGINIWCTSNEVPALRSEEAPA